MAMGDRAVVVECGMGGSGGCGMREGRGTGGGELGLMHLSES